MLDALLRYWWMLPLGLVIGVLGTLVGAGGGFLLVPLLLFMYPGAEPETVTSISLAVACANASAGSVSYARMRRIDFRSGMLFALASVPGAVLGAMITQWMPRRVFDGVFGGVLALIAVVLAVRTKGEAQSAGAEAGAERDRRGRYNLKLGLAISAGVGFVSSVLGVGGGIMHVPALVHVLDFPVHIATATSHFVLAITTAVATLVHVVSGEFEHGVRRAVMLGIGVMVGAPLGARLSTRLHERWIMRGLAAALLVAGLRLLYLGIVGVRA